MTPARAGRSRGLPGSPRCRLLSAGLPAAACCALGLSPGGLPGRLITVGARTLPLSLGVIGAGWLGRVLPGLAGPGFGLGRRGLGAGHRLPRLGQLRLRRGPARLPPVSLGLLGPGLKPGPGLLGRREPRLEPGPLLGIPAGLGQLLPGGPAGLVQLSPGRLGRPCASACSARA
jgi:hypothetical protein